MNPVATSPDPRASLILRGLSGHHLAWLLPGEDPSAAIRSIVSGHCGWSGGEPGSWGQVGRSGIGLYASLRDAWDERAPLLHLSWGEVLDVIRRGCGDGRREAYEAAFEAFGACCRSDDFGGTEFERATDRIHATTEAIVISGCARGESAAQLDLFGASLAVDNR